MNVLAERVRKYLRKYNRKAILQRGKVMEDLTCVACSHNPIVKERSHYICPNCGYQMKCEGDMCLKN